MDLAKQVRKQAAQHGMMLQEVAKKLDITPTSLSYQLHGNPTVATLEKIASVIGCDVADFFKRENDAITCPKCGAKLKLVVEE